MLEAWRANALQGRPLQRFTVRLPVHLHEALFTLSHAFYASMNELVNAAVEEYLMKYGSWKDVSAALSNETRQYQLNMDAVRARSRDPWAG